MRSWPRSHPDYRWPGSFFAPIRLPIGLFLAAIFYVSYALGRLARFARRNAESICVIRTDGIGDAVLFEPALRDLAERFPGKTLHLWAPDATCELFSAHTGVSRTIKIPRGTKDGNLRYFHSLYWRGRVGYLLGRWNYGLSAYLAHSPEPLGNWLFESVEAREKWLTRGDTENQFDWQRDPTLSSATRVFEAQPTGHELIRNARVASQLGGDIEGRLPQIAIPQWASEAAANQIREWWQTASRSGAAQLLGVMPVSAMAVKGYPVDSWAKVIGGLWRSHRAMCVLIGGPSNSRTINELSVALGDVPHLRLPHGAGLLTVAAILARLEGLISVDTGLAHIALSQDVPTVVLRTGGHPGRFFPWPILTRSAVLTKAMPCEGCACRCVLDEAQCVTRIQPGEIIAAYLQLTHRVPETVAA